MNDTHYPLPSRCLSTSSGLPLGCSALNDNPAVHAFHRNTWHFVFRSGFLIKIVVGSFFSSLTHKSFLKKGNTHGPVGLGVHRRSRYLTALSLNTSCVHLAVYISQGIMSKDDTVQVLYSMCEKWKPASVKRHDLRMSLPQVPQLAVANHVWLWTHHWPGCDFCAAVLQEATLPPPRELRPHYWLQPGGRGGSRRQSGGGEGGFL